METHAAMESFVEYIINKESYDLACAFRGDALKVLQLHEP